MVFKVLTYMFWMAVFIAIVVALMWFYQENPAFKQMVDEVIEGLLKNFKEKVGV